MDPIKLKEAGNEEFKKKNYRGAIEIYTQAIVINNQQVSNDASVLYSNRAQCYRKLGMWKECHDDALMAIELHEENIKAQMLCGQALLQLSKPEPTLTMIENGLKRLTRAYSLCSSQNKRAFEKDILMYLSRGKKLYYYKKKEIEEYEKKELINMIEKIEAGNRNNLENREQNNLEMLRSILFENEPEKVLPEFLLDGITKKMIKDPVILPSGSSYDRETLEEFFKLNGTIDPFNR
jgi:STIP1 homology and U-box containing protein 1